MKIQVLGSGCGRCKALFANVESAVKIKGIDCEIEKVTAIEKIVEAGVMRTPALVVDGNVVSSGRVLSADEIAALLVSRDKKPVASVPAGTPAAFSCECGKKKSFARRGFWGVLLMLFALGSLVYAVIRDVPAEPGEALAPASDGVLTVYYFHGAKRCRTCNEIEKRTRETVAEEEDVRFVSVNVELPQNEHFIREFELAGRGVVMAKGGEFEKFDRVWTFAHQPEAFRAYLREGIARLKK